jgi:hypothetical protein
MASQEDEGYRVYGLYLRDSRVLCDKQRDPLMNLILRDLIFLSKL